MTQAFQGYVDRGQIPGAVVLIARKDKVAYFRAFGFRDREQKISMTTDSIFRIASMTKPIVSVGAMMLAEEGKLDIGAPVSQYLPEFKDLKVSVEQVDPATGKKETVLQPQVRPMTVQDLLRHTAGLVYTPPIGTGPIPDAYRAAKVFDPNQTLAELVTKISKLPSPISPAKCGNTAWQLTFLAGSSKSRRAWIWTASSKSASRSRSVWRRQDFMPAKPIATGWHNRRWMRRLKSGRRCSTPPKSRNGSREVVELFLQRPITCSFVRCCCTRANSETCACYLPRP